MKIAIIGLGLIGGSLALEFSKKHTVFGIDNNKQHQQQAIDLGLVSSIISFDEINLMDVVVVAVPVNKITDVVLAVLNKITNNILVFDVGSTKENVCKNVKNHPKRKLFLATHPIAGTEFSGPKAAIKNLFTNKVNIICEVSKTSKKMVQLFKDLTEPLKMRFVFMENASQHDKHIAYVSHLSHISSFMLGKTVLEIEKEEDTIFNMAGSGFESTVRLAKSSPKTWTPIFLQNKVHILNALEEYIQNLQEFKNNIKNNEQDKIYKTIKETNKIKEILKP